MVGKMTSLAGGQLFWEGSILVLNSTKKGALVIHVLKQKIL
jgi:hypothetical protein